MQPQTPASYNPLKTDRKGEQIVFEIRRHPMGMVSVYVSLVMLLALATFSALAAPSVLSDYDNGMVDMISKLVLVGAVFFAIVFAVMARTVYYGTKWILTTDSLTQIGRLGLFNTQSSQLGLDNLEDVTVQQAGIMSHIFNYGVLRCQTAGEYGKFMFTYCPTPNEYAQKLLMAREMFEHGPVHEVKQPN